MLRRLYIGPPAYQFMHNSLAYTHKKSEPLRQERIKHSNLDIVIDDHLDDDLRQRERRIFSGSAISLVGDFECRVGHFSPTRKLDPDLVDHFGFGQHERLVSNPGLG